MRSRLKSRNARGVILDELGKEVNDANTQSDVFSWFFGSVFMKDNGILPDFPIRAGGLLRHIDCSCGNVFESMLELSDQMSDTPEGIPSFFIRRAACSLVYPCSLLFMYSLCFGKLPSLWKHALVKPFLKKPPAAHVASYPPISLAPPFCKIMEILIGKALVFHE